MQCRCGQPSKIRKQQLSCDHLSAFHCCNVRIWCQPWCPARQEPFVVRKYAEEPNCAASEPCSRVIACIDMMDVQCASHRLSCSHATDGSGWRLRNDARHATTTMCFNKPAKRLPRFVGQVPQGVSVFCFQQFLVVHKAFDTVLAYLIHSPVVGFAVLLRYCNICSLPGMTMHPRLGIVLRFSI